VEAIGEKMKLIFIVCLMFSSVFAQTNLETFIKEYKAKNMSKACSLGRQLYRANMRDEKILIATGHACAEDDYIDFIGVLQQRLGQSAHSRHATVYFSTLLLKKRLITEFMYEDANLSLYTLPLTDHILSEVFDAIEAKNFNLISSKPKRLRIGDAQNYIEVYIKDKLYVNVYKNERLVQEHRYR